jgi:hypothetical protein
MSRVYKLAGEQASLLIFTGYGNVCTVLSPALRLSPASWYGISLAYLFT